VHVLFLLCVTFWVNADREVRFVASAEVNDEYRWGRKDSRTTFSFQSSIPSFMINHFIFLTTSVNLFSIFETIPIYGERIGLQLF
jgi:hypothetical protein